MGKGTNSDDWMMLRVCVHMMMVGCGVHLWVHVGSPSAGPPLCFLRLAQQNAETFGASSNT